MKKIIFIVIVVSGIAFLLVDKPKNSTSLEDLKKKTEQTVKDRGRSGQTNSFMPVNSISEINGNWKYSDDLLKIDVSNKTIQFNDGMKMNLEYSSESEGFFIYGRIGNSTRRLILRGIVKISPDKQKIYLDRIDGGISNTYNKVSPIENQLPSIKIVSESKYSDTEQIWIAVYDLSDQWTTKGYNVYKDGKFEFVLKFDEAFASLRSLNGRYVFEPNPNMGIGKKLKECIIKNGWFDLDKNKNLCDCSQIKF